MLKLNRVIILILSLVSGYSQILDSPLLFTGGSTGGGTTGGGSIAFKSIVEGDNGGSSVSSTWSPGSLNVAAGDLVVVGAAGTVDATAVSVGSDALTKISVNTAEGYSVAMWYKMNASANAAATITITAAGANFPSGAAANYSGIATTSALDQNACNVAGCNAQTDSATTHTSQNVTTTVAAELLVAWDISWDDKTTMTAGSNWTKRTAAGTKTWCLLDRVVSSTGTYPSGTVVTVQDTADDGYYELLATFKGL
jgi:hypothetical protein